MKIQQHDGVVVDAAELRQGFAKQLREEEEVLQGGGRRQGCLVRLPLPPLPLYRGKGEGGRSLAPSSKEGVRPRGGEESILPKAPRRCLPLFGLSPLQVSLAHGPLGAGALGPYRPRRTPYSPCGPPGQVDHPGGPSDPFRHSRYNTDKVRNFSGDQNKTSYIKIFTSRPFRNSS